MSEGAPGRLAQLMNSPVVAGLHQRFSQTLKGQALTVALAATVQVLLDIGVACGEKDLDAQAPCPVERGTSLFNQLLYQEGWRMGQITAIAASLLMSALAHHAASHPKDEE